MVTLRSTCWLALLLLAGCSDWNSLMPDAEQGLVVYVPLEDALAATAGLATLTRSGEPMEAEGGGLVFDGTDDHLVATMENPVTVGTSYTMMAWFAADAPNGAVVSCLGDARFMLRANDGEACARTYDALGADFARFEVCVPLAIEEGHHVAVVVDGRDVRMFVDAVLMSEATVPEPATGEEATPECFIGRSGDPADEAFFTGTIDDVRVYDRAFQDEAIGWFLER